MAVWSVWCDDSDDVRRLRGLSVQVPQHLLHSTVSH